MTDWTALGAIANTAVAVATVVLVVVNIVLVVITRRYVTLTGDYVQLTARLADAQEASVRQIRERDATVRADSAVALDALARRLFAGLDLAPRHYNSIDRLRDVPACTQADLERLEQLAAAAGGDAVGWAAVAIHHLPYVQRVADIARSTRVEVGVNWPREFPEQRWPEFMNHFDKALSALIALTVADSMVAPTVRPRSPMTTLS